MSLIFLTKKGAGSRSASYRRAFMPRAGHRTKRTRSRTVKLEPPVRTGTRLRDTSLETPGFRLYTTIESSLQIEIACHLGLVGGEHAPRNFSSITNRLGRAKAQHQAYYTLDPRLQQAPSFSTGP